MDVLSPPFPAHLPTTCGRRRHISCYDRSWAVASPCPQAHCQGREHLRGYGEIVHSQRASPPHCCPSCGTPPPVTAWTCYCVCACAAVGGAPTRSNTLATATCASVGYRFGRAIGLAMTRQLRHYSWATPPHTPCDTLYSVLMPIGC